MDWDETAEGVLATLCRMVPDTIRELARAAAHDEAESVASERGAETAREFRDEGAAVVAWDVAEGADARVDVTDVTAAAKGAAAVAKEHGRIDILVNTAGILRDAQLVKSRGDEITGVMSEADFDAVISVNLRGVFACTQAIAPTMIRQHSGRILNASSVVGLYGNFGQ